MVKPARIQSEAPEQRLIALLSNGYVPKTSQSSQPDVEELGYAIYSFETVKVKLTKAQPR